MSLNNPIPILFIPFVALPGRHGKLQSSSDAEKKQFVEIIKTSKKTIRDGSPLLIGLIPSRSGSLDLTPGMVGTLVKLVSYSTKLSSNVGELTFKAEKRLIVEKKAASTGNFASAYVRVHEDAIESVESISKLLEQKGVSSIALQYLYNNMKRFNFEGSIEQIAEELDFSFDDKMKILVSLSFSERLLELVRLLENYAPVLKVPPMRKSILHIDLRPPSLTSSKGIKIRPGIGDHSHKDKDGDFLEKIEAANMPPAIKKVALDNFNRLQSMNSFNSDYNVVRNYLETLISLPWMVSSKDEIDITKAKQELDSGHYGMDKVKRRIMEYLAVRQLKKSQLKGPILCFVGAPGVGKTSIGRSIANILGRKFQRICLGGVSDASEIRGTRRTYIGSMPGRIIDALKRCGTNNPVILLDEIDKMSSKSPHGNPLAALLEVLDPEQNSQFTDHYIALPFDLSQVIFLATANDMTTIPPALGDRMEVLLISGYTEEEKYHIATNFIIPKLLVDHGLDSESIIIPEKTLRFIVSSYSTESGVRMLERNLASLCRDAALKVASNSTESVQLLIDEETVRAVLGGPPYHKFSDGVWATGDVPGVVIGLAYNAMGGDILPIEATKLVPGTGKLILTGKLGQVLSESAQIAWGWFKTASLTYQIYEDLKKIDVHIHLPSGAVSKEGPSAGIALATALVSLFSGIAPLPNLGLTGELSLQGHVLPVGGLKEKLTAARRAGLTKVILPKKCESRMDDVTDHLLDSMEIVLVNHMSEVIECAFDGALTANAALISKL